MIRFAAGAITGMILSYIIGIGLVIVERRATHATRKPDWRDVVWDAYR